MMKPIAFIALLTLLFVNQSFSQKPPIFSTAEGAINGYDVVSYYHLKPEKGVDSLSFRWNDAVWKFSSRANLDSFAGDPTRFAPQYGGYCAYGVSSNYKAPTSADAWSIVGNKLYLNYNKAVQTSWKKEQEERIIVADKNWPALVNK